MYYNNPLVTTTEETDKEVISNLETDKPKAYIKNTFCTITQQLISKIISKQIQYSYNYLCFMRPDKKKLRIFSMCCVV